MTKGTVKTVTDKGFGFITTEEYDKDIFYHENSLLGPLKERKLREGDKVEFEVERTDKGFNAINIVLVEEE